MRNCTKIPQIIHLVFLSKTENFPDIFTGCIVKLKSLHKKWEIKIYNEDDAQNIITNWLPELLPIYNAYPHYIQRADLFRVVLVYLFGGVYMDMDMFCIKPLDQLLKFDLILPEERSITTRQRAQLAQLDGIVVKHNFRLGNYMFGGMAKHPFWLYYLKEAIKQSAKEIKHEGDILETTGPALLTKVYHKYGKNFPKTLVLANRDRQCIMPPHKEISCHFGNFASHLHQGTWRWMHKNNKLLLKNSIEPHLIQEANTTIHSKIKTIIPQKIFLVKHDYDESRSILYKQISRQLSFLTVLYSNAQDLKNNHKVIIIGPESFNKQKLNPSIKYTLVLDNKKSKLTKQVLGKIKKYKVTCIVFSELMQKQLIQHNASFAIYKTDIFYMPVKRDFSDNDTMMQDFNFGLYSDLSVTAINWLKKLQKVLNSTGNRYQLQVFHNNDRISKKLIINGIVFTDIGSIALTDKINQLSVFLCHEENIESALLFQTSFYMGIPSIANKSNTIIKKDILNFALCYNSNNSNNIDPIMAAVNRLKDNYLKFNKKALLASRYIEDKYSIEKITYNIIKAALD